MYEHLPAEKLSQGDIIKQVQIVKKNVGAVKTPVETAPANIVVLTHSCEIDKIADYRKDGPLLVACVFPFTLLDKGNQGNVRANRIRNLFALPPHELLPVECYIDWRTIQPMEVMSLVERRDTDTYVCTLTGTLLEAASQRLWEFFFRPAPLPQV